MSGVVKFSITIFFYKFIAESASKKLFISVNIWQNCRQKDGFQSFLPDCFAHFVDMAISVTKYFHKVVWQHMQGVVGSLIITSLQIS